MIDRILETDHNYDKVLNVIYKHVLLPLTNYSSKYLKYKSRKSSELYSPRHQLQSKIQKNVYNYSQRYIDDFKLIVVNPSPKLTYQESNIIATSFLLISHDQSIENNINIILTHLLNRWHVNKSSSHTVTYALTHAELVVLKVYSTELK